MGVPREPGKGKPRISLWKRWVGDVHGASVRCQEGSGHESLEVCGGGGQGWEQPSRAASPGRAWLRPPGPSASPENRPRLPGRHRKPFHVSAFQKESQASVSPSAHLSEKPPPLACTMGAWPLSEDQKPPRGAGVADT